MRGTASTGAFGILLALLLALATVGADPVTAQADPTALAASTAPRVDADSVIDPSAPIVTLRLDRADAANGDRVTASVAVTNPGPEPLLLRCARPVAVWADITGAVEGPREDWATTDPWRRGMRRSLLGDPLAGTGPLAVPFAAVERGPACPKPTLELAAGDTLSRELRWSVGYPDGTPLHSPEAGSVVVRAQVMAADPDTVADAEPDAPRWGAAEQPLAVRPVRDRRILSPAGAIEALFADPAAAGWLDLEHSGTWRRWDLRLGRGKWRFEVRRIATGCCRESLSAVVDDVSGTVNQLDAPLLAWEPVRTATAVFENVELRIDLQRRLFRDGRTTRIRVTATKQRGGGPVWYWSHDNACTLQPGIWIAAGPESVGMRWPGVLGRFKEQALRGEVIIAPGGPPQQHVCRTPEPVKLLRRAPVTIESFYRPAIVPTGQRTLEAVGRIDLVGPAPDAVQPWRVYASPTVRTRFRTGTGSAQMLSPGTLIDAALSKGDFAERIKAVPRGQWHAAGVTGSSVWLELRDGTRIVGLP